MSKEDMFTHTIRAIGILISGTGYEHSEKSELFHTLANNVIQLTEDPPHYLDLFQQMLGQNPSDPTKLN
jgi:hypothetical protein